tara:strand:+ start:2315 stop:2758 length:444 start_codon:yes stop_codon:yes gene_type:complete
MAGFKLKVMNQNGFDSRIRKQGSSTEANVKRVINSIANNIRNIAVSSILQNSRSGGQTTRYNPKRTINVSKAGDPPASDSGYLASQIVVKIDGNQLGADIISNADYSEALEYGTIKMGARPFMQPAAEESRKKYEQQLTKAIKSGLK